MIVYGLLLLVTAAISYLMGSMNTLVLASNFIFHFNLNRFGHGNNWLSNFKRVYGLKGALELLLVEAIKDIIPIVIGGLLLGIKGHADVGRAFAGFCLVMGRLWPVFYDLKGTCGVMPLFFAGLFADVSLGIVAVIVFIAVLFFSKYVPVAAMVTGLVIAAAPLLIVESRVVIYLMAFIGAAVIIRHIPGLIRAVKGREEKITFKEDLTYKLDSKF